MATAQTAFRTRPALYRHSTAAARQSQGAETPLFQAFLYPSSVKVTDGLCIKDATKIDPTCGSGGLLLKAYKKVPSGKVAVDGQELNAQTWALCTMNMFLRGVDDARIWQDDTLSNPQNIEDDKLMKFQVVVANPPFSLGKWDSGFLSNAGLDAKGKKQEKMTSSMDAWKRFDWGAPPRPRAIMLSCFTCCTVWTSKTDVWQLSFLMASSSAVQARGRFASSWSK